MAITPDEESTCFLNGAPRVEILRRRPRPRRPFQLVCESRKEALLRTESVSLRSGVSKDGFSSPKIHGVGRCFLHFCARVVVSDSQIECGSKIAEMAKGMWSRSAPLCRQEQEGRRAAPRTDSAPVGNAIHKEPFGDPASSTAVGLLVSETLRELRKAKRHRSSPCRVGIGPWTANDPVNDTADEFDRPGPFLIIADVDLEKEKVELKGASGSRAVVSPPRLILEHGFGLDLPYRAPLAGVARRSSIAPCTSIVGPPGAEAQGGRRAQARAVPSARASSQASSAAWPRQMCAGSITPRPPCGTDPGRAGTPVCTPRSKRGTTSHSNIPSPSTTPWCGCRFGTGKGAPGPSSGSLPNQNA